MPISIGGEYNDVINDGYTSKTLSITAAAEVNAYTGSANLAGREILTLKNKGSKRVYFGPTGTAIADRDYLEKGESVSLPAGENILVTLICDTGDTASVVVQEMA
jgi:hypothetical protein